MREFRLSPAGNGRGISCDANGAFVDCVPLLKRTRANGKEIWEPRNREELSAELGAYYGLPIDISTKAHGLAAIARALNEGSVARAQLGTLHLRFPDLAPLAKAKPSYEEIIAFVRGLYESDLLKADWDPTKHPRWPADAPDSQGGRFAPKGMDDGEQLSPSIAISADYNSADGPKRPIQIAANISSGPICREVAAAGCIAAGAATAPEAAGAGCAVTGPACPAGAAVGGTVTAIGSCIIGGAAAYVACEGANASNPDRPSDRAIRDQCLQRCSPLLERPERPGKRGKNEWDFRKCVDDCIKEKKEYWGD